MGASQRDFTIPCSFLASLEPCWSCGRPREPYPTLAATGFVSTTLPPCALCRHELSPPTPEELEIEVPFFIFYVFSFGSRGNQAFWLPGEEAAPPGGRQQGPCELSGAAGVPPSPSQQPMGSALNKSPSVGPDGSAGEREVQLNSLFFFFFPLFLCFLTKRSAN